MLTLIDVAKPWIVESPAPVTCQSAGAVPASVFSQAITLTTGGPHGPAAAAGCAEMAAIGRRAPMRLAMASTAVRVRHRVSVPLLCRPPNSGRARSSRADERIATAFTTPGAHED